MKFAVLAGMVFSMAAMAAQPEVTTFKCVTDTVIEGEAPTKINFQVQNLGKAEVNYYTQDEDSDSPVEMIPEESNLMLNDNWSIEQKKIGLHMEADGDGCQWTDFVLYKNSGYIKGYVRITDKGCGAKPAYSTVTCSVK